MRVHFLKWTLLLTNCESLFVVDRPKITLIISFDYELFKINTSNNATVGLICRRPTAIAFPLFPIDGKNKLFVRWPTKQPIGKTKTDAKRIFAQFGIGRKFRQAKCIGRIWMSPYNRRSAQCLIKSRVNINYNLKEGHASKIFHCDINVKNLTRFEQEFLPNLTSKGNSLKQFNILIFGSYYWRWEPQAPIIPPLITY